jgi:nicotinamidase-related amidase
MGRILAAGTRTGRELRAGSRGRQSGRGPGHHDERKQKLWFSIVSIYGRHVRPDDLSTAAATSIADGPSGGRTMPQPYNRLDIDQAAVLLVDHQAGLMSLVRDIDPDRFRNNVLAVADLAAYFKLPTILTTSFEDGPNGPLMPELKAKFPDAPYIARPGQINAWDNPDFVAAVKATGRKQLLIAGVVTEVCVAFVALSAIAEGYEVFAITDASGTFGCRRPACSS